MKTIQWRDTIVIKQQQCDYSTSTVWHKTTAVLITVLQHSHNRHITTAVWQQCGDKVLCRSIQIPKVKVKKKVFLRTRPIRQKRLKNKYWPHCATHLLSAQLLNKFGYCLSFTVAIVLALHKHNSLPLDRYEPSFPSKELHDQCYKMT